MKIEDKNLAIAKYIKFRLGNALKVMEGYADYCGKHDLNFHCCWDSLNLAVEKIEKKGFTFFITYRDKQWTCSIHQRTITTVSDSIVMWKTKTKLEAVHNCVYDFISPNLQKWLNENKHKK